MSSVVMPLQSRRDQWTDGLMLNKHGVALGNLRNVLYALRNAPEWQGVLAYDEFAARAITRKPPPWSDQAVERWMDYHDARGCEWFEEHEIAASSGGGGSRHSDGGTRASLPPCSGLPERVELGWNTTARHMARHLSRRGGQPLYPGDWFAVSYLCRRPRVQPGMPSGPHAHPRRSSGNSEIVRAAILGKIHGSRTAFPDWAARIPRWKWPGVSLIEMSELDALTKATNSAIKSFVTRRHDRFRPPYGKHVVEQPRQCVFAGSINPTGGYLKDPTGARRFWPVACGVIDLEALARDRDQLWAEAVVRFRAGAAGGLRRRTSSPGDCRASRSIRGRCLDRKGQQLAGWPRRCKRRRSAGWRTRRPAGKLVTDGTEPRRRHPRLQRVQGYRPGKTGQPRTPRYHREAVKPRAISGRPSLNKKSD